MRPLSTAPALAGKHPAGLPPAAALASPVPGYFAFVMATGIVSLAAHQQQREPIARALFWLNVFAYGVLWVLSLVRLARFPDRFIAELTHPARGATFLAMTAATCVLGSQLALLTPWMAVARALWFVGAGLWLVLGYTFVAAITVCEPKPSLEDGISGAWLLVVVATESISVLGALVAPSMRGADLVLFAALGAHFAGAMLYVFLATLILYRWIFFRMTPDRLTPDYWINMGALAISALAGTLLLRASGHWKLLGDLAPFLVGLTLFFWAAATWWIPLLLILGVWRHLRGRAPLVYSPKYWSLVFPLGMYAAASFMLVEVTGLKFLSVVAEVSFYVALAAWAVTFAGLLHHSAAGTWKPGTSDELLVRDGPD